MYWGLDWIRSGGVGLVDMLQVRLLPGVVGREWCFTTNHKRLGLGYVAVGGVSTAFGTTLASLIRLELGQPGSFVFAMNAGGYHIVVSVHAIIMVFFVVTPVIFGGFGNYFLPVQAGARDVAYPRLNNFSMWLLPAGLVAMLRALWEGSRLLVFRSVSEPGSGGSGWSLELGSRGLWPAWDRRDFGFGSLNFAEEFLSYCSAAEEEFWLSMESSLSRLIPLAMVSPRLTSTMAGWTFTTPFSHSRFTGRAVDWSLLGLVISTVTSILTTINLVSTWRFLRGRGARYQRELLPIFTISVFISLRMLLAASPILTAGFLMLLADRHFSTSFFTVRAGGDIMLFQHIFWFFGHPEVYILVVPGFGVASTLVPYFVRKPISSKMHMVYAMHAIACMAFVVWGHHLYLVGIDSKARTLFMTVTIMIGLPSSLKVCGWVVSLANGITFAATEFWLVIIFISIFFVGGMSGLMVAGAGLDILLHDTYYVVGHFHVMLSGAMVLSIIGWLYFNSREVWGVAFSTFCVGWHIGCHAIGHFLTFVPMLWLGYAGMPRRIHDYPFGYTG